MRIKLTTLQAEEVRYGLDLDESETDPESNPAGWGSVICEGSSTFLQVHNPDAAIYRITSSRDIHESNAPLTDGREAAHLRGLARSLDGLARKIMKAAGGPEALDDISRHYLEV